MKREQVTELLYQALETERGKERQDRDRRGSCQARPRGDAL